MEMEDEGYIDQAKGHFYTIIEMGKQRNCSYRILPAYDMIWTISDWFSRHRRPLSWVSREVTTTQADGYHT